MIKAVIFDIDGTLVHTSPEYVGEIVHETLSAIGRPNKINEKEIAEFWFGVERDPIIISWNATPEDFWNTFSKLDKPERRKNFTCAYPDLWVLEELQKKKLKLAAITNAHPGIVAINLEKIPLAFDLVINSHIHGDGIRPKPDPHGIEECMRILGTKREEILMIGNSLEDHLAAKAAGVKDFFVDRNEHTIEIPSENKIRSLAEILDILQPY